MSKWTQKLFIIMLLLPLYVQNRKKRVKERVIRTDDQDKLILCTWIKLTPLGTVATVMPCDVFTKCTI